ncbi:alpha-L-fucosidase [Sarracenia purpurea var. burkii]
MGDGDWVMVRRPTEKDLWEPSLIQTDPSKPLEVRFKGPAKHWTDAIPIGNGRLGAMVWGGVQSETLNLNDDTLWTGIPGNYTNPDAPTALSEVRKLVDDGKYAEATTEAVKLSGNPSGEVYDEPQPLRFGLGMIYQTAWSAYTNCAIASMSLSNYILKALQAILKLFIAGDIETVKRMSFRLYPRNLPVMMKVYQLLGDIKLEFDDSHAAYSEETYWRVLDLDTATTKVRYSIGDVEFTREHFASNPDQVIVTKISGSKSGSLSFMVSLDSKLHHHSRVNDINQILIEGSCPGSRIPPKANENDDPKGIQFSAILHLQISDEVGAIHVLDDRKLKVEGSDWAVMLLVASSSFDGPFIKPLDSKRNPTSECLNTLNSIKNLSFDGLYARHLDDYQNLFHRVSLQLSKSSKSFRENRPFQMKERLSSATDQYLESTRDEMVATSERVKSFQDDEDPSLVELLFQYGRYLLISCSRPGTQVANLQGIWNKDIEPPWE